MFTSACLVTCLLYIPVIVFVELTNSIAKMVKIFYEYWRRARDGIYSRTNGLYQTGKPVWYRPFGANLI